MYLRSILITFFLASFVQGVPHKSRSLQLVKRAYPNFQDWPDDDVSKDRQRILKDALPDAIDLVTRAAEAYELYKDIWSKYFPDSDHKKVMDVYKRVVSDPTNPGEGEDRLKYCEIVGFDVDRGKKRDPCLEGSAAYTLPVPAGLYLENPQGSTITYFCDPAYEQPRKYEDIKCNDIGDTVNEKMDFLGATISTTGTGTHITDVNDEEGYGPYNTRQLRKDEPDHCINNADSYTWLALEVFWTRLCLKKDRYKDPVKPKDVTCHHAADPSGAMGVCLNIASTGWCDCGSAGNYPITPGDNPCAYTTQPPLAAMNIHNKDCVVTPPKPSSRQCGNYTSPVEDVKNINKQLNDWGDDKLCCSNGKAGCVNIALSGSIAVDLCSESTTPLCVGCARLGNYVAGMIGACQQDGKVGGKQDIVEAAGLSVQI